MALPDLGKDVYRDKVVSRSLEYRGAQSKGKAPLYPIACIAHIVISDASRAVRKFEEDRLNFTPRNTDEYLEIVRKTDPDGVILNSWAKIIAAVGMKNIELGFWKGRSIEAKPGTTQKKEPGWSRCDLIGDYNIAVSGTHLPRINQGQTEWNAYELSIIHGETYLNEQAEADKIARTVRTSPERGYPFFGYYYDSDRSMLELPMLAAIPTTALRPHHIVEENINLTPAQKEMVREENRSLQQYNEYRQECLTVLRHQILIEGRWIQTAAEALIANQRILQAA